MSYSSTSWHKKMWKHAQRSMVGERDKNVNEKLWKHAKTSGETCENMWHNVKTCNYNEIVCLIGVAGLFGTLCEVKDLGRNFCLSISLKRHKNIFSVSLFSALWVPTANNWLKGNQLKKSNICAVFLERVQFPKISWEYESDGLTQRNGREI